MQQILIQPQPVQKEIPLTFLELINQRLVHIKAYNSKKYLNDHIYMARKWVKKWANLPVEDITTAMLQEHILERSLVSPHEANKDRKYLQAVFSFAVQQEIIPFNPVAKIKKLPMEKRIKYIPPKEDILKVLVAATSEVRDYLYLIIDTAARVSEINHLTWDDVNWADQHIVLYTRKKAGGHLTGRKIPMSSRVHTILSRRFKNRDTAKPWIFWQTYWMKGQKVEGPYIYRSKILKTLCKRTGVKDFQFHSLRHFGASVMLHHNVPKSAIQKILGHERSSTTDIYLQALDDSDRKAIDALENGLESVEDGANCKTVPLGMDNGTA
jgi:integrase